MLDPRAAELLKLLVERYIRDGEPVGSRTLSRALHLGLSPATIRNVMSDLDQLGFVRSPHTSAGRIPTTRAYRYFVDTLLVPESLTDEEKAHIAQTLLPRDLSDEGLIAAASNILSSLTRMAGVVTVPKRNMAILRRIEFLPLSDRRVLAVLVVNHHEVQNRIVHVEREISADELERFAGMLNQHFAGKDLIALHRALTDDLLRARDSMNRALLDAVTLAEQAMRGGPSEGFVVAGGSNLMGFQELADVQRLKQLFEAFDHKRDLLDLFDQCLHAEGVQIFIGEESGYTVLDDCSVVTAPYYVEGEVAGVLGVIGPTRMAYHRIIPLVQETAKALSEGLKQSH